MPIYPSQYKFTQPVRYFKANDPYYYEVDNLPVRQLEENILWLKDQYSTFLGTDATGSNLGFLRAGDDIDWEWIKQFRPKWQAGRTIKVQAGRYIGRVNDAYKKEATALAYVNTIGATAGADQLVPALRTGPNTQLNEEIWQNFSSDIGTLSTPIAVRGVNCGLETMFTFHISRPLYSSYSSATTSPFGDPIYGDTGTESTDKTWPAMWHDNFRAYSTGPWSVFDINDFSNLSKRHMQLVRKWKGVFRTAVMDFLGEDIDIAPFDSLDFFIENPVAPFNKTPIANATQRLDLVVVYGHPVDSSSTAIAGEYPGTNSVAPGGQGAGATGTTGVSTVPPRTITSPRLGVIRGAGVGLMNATNGVPTDPAAGLQTDIDIDSHTTAPGTQKILANPNAEGGASNTGITLADGSVVNGSFPSPDDLGNLAPNLAYDLLDNNTQLVGQCVLPICYVLVEENVTALSQANIIDIRPFLRGAELTYNERAGVAAAEPALSLGNPAVGIAQLQNAYNTLDAKIGAQPVGGTTAVTGGPVGGVHPASTGGTAPRMQYINLPVGTNARYNTPGDYWSLPGRGYQYGASRAVAGCRMNDTFVLGDSIVAFGYGEAFQTLDGPADVDGFSKWQNDSPNPIYQAATTNPWYLEQSFAPHDQGGDSRYNVGVPIFGIDISTFKGSTVEETEANIMASFAVQAKVSLLGFDEDKKKDSVSSYQTRGWSVVERSPYPGQDPVHLLTVRYDMFRHQLSTPTTVAADIILVKRTFTFS